MKSYNFRLCGIANYLWEIIRNEPSGKLGPYGEGVHGVAILETDDMDIELNLYGPLPNYKKVGEEPYIRMNYSCCEKKGEDDWVFSGFSSHAVNVDWCSNEWPKLLKADMWQALKEYREEKEWIIVDPNLYDKS